MADQQPPATKPRSHTRLAIQAGDPAGGLVVEAERLGHDGVGPAGRRRIAITMAGSGGNTFFANFSTYDAPLPTKVRLALANSWRKVRTRSGCCRNHGQPGC
jgi:hypothetical protein